MWWGINISKDLVTVYIWESKPTNLSLVYALVLQMFFCISIELIKSWSTEGLELRGWVNGPKWRNCWIIVTPTSLTSEMSLSWPSRYTSIHELNKIINSPNILRLSSFILASLQQLNSCSCNQDLYCNSMHSHWQCRLKIRRALYLAFEWRVQTNIWI